MTTINQLQNFLTTLSFRSDRLNMLIALVFVSGVIFYYIYRAGRGDKFFLRKISGIQAIEEAIGRATEMGRPMLYCTGVLGMESVETLAGLNILGHVAYKAAQYDTPIDVPNISPMVMAAAQEVVQQACLRAGRPDAYRAERICFTSGDQFGYAAALNGMIMRDRPAAVFMLGSFYAEALLIAETGNHIGAIQIAGTAQPSQLPFFIAACDYTLIGEELFAASAYLAQEPKLLGSLRGQDVAKMGVIVVIVTAVVVEFLVRYNVLGHSWSLLSRLATY